MINNKDLSNYCNNYLNVDNFADYCPNGLQIEGKPEINKIIAGVSANIDLIQRAIEESADALIVHHGYFWKNENQSITGTKRNRIASLINNDINLFAYHLPLDAHPIVGNNYQLAKILKINNPKPIKDTLVWVGEVDLTLQSLSENITRKLQRKPMIFGDINRNISRVCWCTGAAQDKIDVAIDFGADLFISGEVSEQIPAIAKESGISFISAGHHATERYGVQALGKHLSDKFDLDYYFIDIDNRV
jgi:dinuclear metal center YbgI/SA1388 family protein